MASPRKRAARSAEKHSTLVVLGGGPKAAALCAKARVLRELKIADIKVVVIERNEPAANWTGRHGFTNGRHSLGTPPEKDVGFPYANYFDGPEGPEVNPRLFAEYSWPAYMVRRAKKYGEWIDRGKQHPPHSQWAEYCAWVLKETANKILIGQPRSIAIEGDRWKISVRCQSNKTATIQSDGLVVTGPGPAKVPLTPAKMPLDVPKHKRILNGDSFWKHLRLLRKLRVDEGALPIVVLGGGETSASVVSELLDYFHYDPHISIIVLTRSGAIFSRGEGYYENKIFTQTTNWGLLPPEVRREVIGRGDRGVFSIEAIKKINNAGNINHRFMTVSSVSIDPDDSNEIIIRGDTNEGGGEIKCQLLVLASGFDSYWFSKLITDASVRAFLSSENAAGVEEKIGFDLSVGLPLTRAKLYLPMVSAFAQGPGFPNLSCLGILSDRILGSIARSL